MVQSSSINGRCLVNHTILLEVSFSEVDTDSFQNQIVRSFVRRLSILKQDFVEKRETKGKENKEIGANQMIDIQKFLDN